MSIATDSPRSPSFVQRCRECTLDETCGFHGQPELERISERRFYGRNFTVIQQGNAATHAYIVCAGWLQIIHLTSAGRAVSELAGPGTILGLAGVMAGSGYCNSARTLEECELQQIERDALLNFARDNPTVSLRLLKTMSLQWQRSLRHLYDLSSKVPTEKRLLRALCEISETCGNPANGGVRIRVPLSVQVLAETVGCSRQWVSKMLGQLEQKGLIRHRSSWISVTHEGLKGHR